MWDLDFRVVEWNSTAAKIFGWSETKPPARATWRPSGAVADDDMTAALAQVRDGQGPRGSQSRHRTHNDTTVDMEWFHTALHDESGAVIGVASMGHDITRRILLEQELAQAQKMEAVGALAGGIAHDFNNLLTAILGNLALLQFQIGPSHPAAKGLRDGVQAAERAAELTQQLLRFSRRSACKPAPVNLAKRLEEVVQLFQMGVESPLELRCSIDDALWLTAADETQIAQVVMNLLVNARDAVPDQGVIEVSARNRRLTRAESSSRGWADGNHYVEIEVWDNGGGIDESIRDRIFEPFFTTKPVGKGTGLGLATAYAIIQRHRGGLEVESKPGLGTTFRILLPRHETQDNQPAAPPSGRVLLVEPDPLLARNAASALESAGYTTLIAANQADAVAALRESAAELSLAALALRLPDGGGGRVIAEARERRPDLPLLVTSEKVFAGWSEPGSTLLKRPYTGEEIVAAVGKSLTAETPTAPTATHRKRPDSGS
jgi:two-component system, cell cycle sensor histidine kinase and response regulator CckA